MVRVLVGALVLALAVAAGARADPLPAAVRAGNHETFGRIVVDLPAGVTAYARAEGAGGVRVHIIGGTLAGSVHPPTNVVAVNIEGSDAHLILAPGARFTATHMAGRLAIDVFAGTTPTALAAAAPPRVAPAAPAVVPKGKRGKRFSGPAPRPWPNQSAPPSAAPPSAAAPPPAQMESPAGTALPPDMAATGGPESLRVPLQQLLQGTLPGVLRPPSPASPAPASPPADTAAAAPLTAPVTEVARTPLPPPGGQGPLAIAAQPGGETMVLPFAATTGAAAFRRGGQTVVVFDERRPLDLSGLHDDPAMAAAFGDAQVQLLPEATVVRITLPPQAGLTLSRTAAGWALASVAQSPTLEPIRGDIADGAMRLAAAAPGQVISVPDPETGGALLVGTQTKPGQGVPVRRRTPDFTLLQTMQGVAVEPASDALTLQVAPPRQPPGFVLATAATPGGPPGGPGVALDPLGPEALAALDAARMTRRWDFPALPTEALLRRLQAATEDAAAAPPQARTAGRLAATQAMLALGLGAEADALGSLIVTDDARAVDDPDLAGLTAVAALLAGRLGEADAITAPRLDGTDEVTLWRAARLAMQREGAPEAAAGFAATIPLLLAYPQALRDRLLPLAAETMVLGGEPEAARRLLEARKDDGGLDYARGLLAERDGHAAPALAIYDRLAQSPDRRLSYRAGLRAAELRLGTGAFTMSQAADALDKQIYAWRGGPHELALRLRVAELRQKSGNWRAALALLRETGSDPVAQTWPDAKATIRGRMGEVFAQALAGDSRAALPPLELVSLLEENPDLLPDGEAGRALASRLADRLVALDLPKRAGPVLEKLMNATPPGAARAELGARLAALRLDQSDPTGALEALSASAAEGLPPAVDEARTITFARATAARGALAPATAALAALGTPAADEARATLLERARDWPGAVSALESYAQRTVPPEGPLADVPAQVLLRLASAAAQAGDEPLLTHLRDHDLLRMPAGKFADMFKLLTERPVQGVADLPRAAQEAALARGLPAALKMLGAGVVAP